MQYTTTFPHASSQDEDINSTYVSLLRNHPHTAKNAGVTSHTVAEKNVTGLHVTWSAEASNCCSSKSVSLPQTLDHPTHLISLFRAFLPPSLITRTHTARDKTGAQYTRDTHNEFPSYTTDPVWGRTDRCISVTYHPTSNTHAAVMFVLQVSTSINVTATTIAPRGSPYPFSEHEARERSKAIE